MEHTPFHHLVHGPMDARLSEAIASNERRLGRRLTDHEASDLFNHYLELSGPQAASTVKKSLVIITRKAGVTGEHPPHIWTPQFKDWFGDWESEPHGTGVSKVVHRDGKPMVLYHSTESPSFFREFKRNPKDVGIHFGTFGQAQERADRKSDEYGIDSGARKPIAVHLNIKNPLRLRDSGDWGHRDLFNSLIASRSHRIPENEIHAAYRSSRNAGTKLKNLRELIESHGYDGIVYRNSVEIPGMNELRKQPVIDFDASQKLFAKAEDSYLAFHAHQIKSAYNGGRFDEGSDDMYKALPRIGNTS